VREQWIHLVRIDTEALLDPERGGTRGTDLTRVCIDGRRTRADRKLDDEAGVDRAAVRRHLDRLAVLIRREVSEGLGAHGLEPTGAKQRDRDPGGEESDEEANAPIRDPRGHCLWSAVPELEVRGRRWRTQVER